MWRGAIDACCPSRRYRAGPRKQQPREGERTVAFPQKPGMTDVLQAWSYKLDHRCSTRHADVLFQSSISLVAHSVDLSLWHEVHGLGILYLSDIAGVMNRKVCA